MIQEIIQEELEKSTSRPFTDISVLKEKDKWGKEKLMFVLLMLVLQRAEQNSTL